MLNLKSKYMIGFLVSMISIVYIDALITGPLQNVKTNDNKTTIKANI